MGSGEYIIIRNYIVYLMVDIIERIIINRLRWAGHIISRENEEIIKRIMIVKPEAKRKKGKKSV
jgi:hypothetical protein